MKAQKLAIPVHVPKVKEPEPANVESGSSKTSKADTLETKAESEEVKNV